MNKEKAYKETTIKQTMDYEDLILIIKDLLSQIKDLVRMQNKQSEFYEGLMSKGLIFEKKVSKFARTSGAIYVPKRLIEKSFKVILIPIEDGDKKLPKRGSKHYPEKENTQEEIKRRGK